MPQARAADDLSPVTLLSLSDVSIEFGATTVLQRGLPWLDNDLVNLGCGLFGLLSALALMLLL